MDFISISLIAIALALDCFSVALCVGTMTGEKDFRFYFRLAFHFGFFQGGMALLGYLAGSAFVDLIAPVDHWIAFGLLAYVGVSMIRDGANPALAKPDVCPSRGMKLIVLSLATSIDSLAVGLSFALVDQSIGWPSLIIGLTSLLFTIIGLRLGDQLGHRFGKRMEIVGGVILLGIGARILLTDLLA